MSKGKPNGVEWEYTNPSTNLKPIGKEKKVKDIKQTLEDASVEKYKVGMYINNLLFLKKEDLKEIPNINLFEIEKYPVNLDDLSDAGIRAFEAIIELIASTNYEGNGTAQYQRLEAFDNEQRKIIQMSFTITEYLKAYGLSEDMEGKFSGADRREKALSALEELAKERFLIWKTKKFDKNKTIEKIKYGRMPLITILGEITKETTKQETTYKNEIKIYVNPLFLEDLDTFYLLRRFDKKDVIKELAEGNYKLQIYLNKFTAWLEGWGITTFSISDENLAKKVGLDWLVKKREKAKLSKRLEELAKLAKKGGWLISWKHANRIFTFELNPEYCSRAGNKKG